MLANTENNVFSTAEVVTKHDTNANIYHSLYIGGTGHVNVVTADGQTCLFSAVPVGAILPISVTKVLSTSTTATLIIGLK